MVFSAPPNCCKRMTKRRLFAPRPRGRLEQSALRGGALSARPFSKRRTKRAAVSVAVFSRFAIYANVVGPTGITFAQCGIRTALRSEDDFSARAPAKVFHGRRVRPPSNHAVTREDPRAGLALAAPRTM